MHKPCNPGDSILKLQLFICYFQVVNESEGQMYCLKDSVKHLKKKRNIKTSIMLYRHPTVRLLKMNDPLHIRISLQKDLEEVLSNVLSRLAAEESPSKRRGPRIKQAS
jgi:hypothetical protein